MPTLHWVGKDKVVNHHHDMPFRVLNKVSTFSPPEGLPTNPDRATRLDMGFLAALRFGGNTGASKPGTVIICADRCLLSKAFMTQHGILFKKIPRDITRF